MIYTNFVTKCKINRQTEPLRQSLIEAISIDNSRLTAAAYTQYRSYFGRAEH